MAGRPKGSLNKRTAAQRERLRAMMEAGLTPLDVILGAMRGEMQPSSLQLQCAIAAAPYCHARLQSTEMQLDADVRSTNVVSDKPLTPAEWLEKYGDKSYQAEQSEEATHG